MMSLQTPPGTIRREGTGDGTPAKLSPPPDLRPGSEKGTPLSFAPGLSTSEQLVSAETISGFDGATLRARLAACHTKPEGNSPPRVAATRPPPNKFQITDQSFLNQTLDTRFQITDQGFVDTKPLTVDWTRLQKVHTPPSTSTDTMSPSPWVHPPYRSGAGRAIPLAHERPLKNITAKVKAKGDEVREAKKAKASKEVVVSLIDELKALKAEYEKLAGEPWPKQEKRKGAGEKSSEIIIPPEELLKKKLKRSQEYQAFMMKRLRKAKFDQRLFEKELFETGGTTYHASSCPNMHELGGSRFTEEFGTLRAEYNEWSWSNYKRLHESNSFEVYENLYKKSPAEASREVEPRDRLKKVIELGAMVTKSSKRYERMKHGLPPLLPDEIALQRRHEKDMEKKVSERRRQREQQAATREEQAAPQTVDPLPTIVVVKTPWRPTSRELQDI
jgi:hypothetical protein